MMGHLTSQSNGKRLDSRQRWKDNGAAGLVRDLYFLKVWRTLFEKGRHTFFKIIPR